MSENRSRCLLCPRFCELKSGMIGSCHVRVNNNGSIIPKDYGAVSSVAVEPIEKKPFRHFLPGTKTLSIGGFGCSLECVYCESTSISQSCSSDKSYYLFPKDAVDIAKEKKCESVCLTYNEPTVAIEYLIDMGNLCHKNNLKFIIKTNAYINEEPWEEVCRVVDAMNIDYKGSFKDFEDITQCRYSDYGRKIRAAINRRVHVEISIPIFHGYKNGDGSYFLPLKNCFYGALNGVCCHVLKINPANLMINDPTTSDEEIFKAKQDLQGIFKKDFIY